MWPDLLDLFGKGILALSHFHDLRSELRKVLLKLKSNRLINVRLAATTYSRFVPMFSLFTISMGRSTQLGSLDPSLARNLNKVLPQLGRYQIGTLEPGGN